MSEAHQALKSSSRFHHERDGAQETSMGAAKVDQKRDVRAKFFKFSRFRPMSEAHQALKSSSRFHQPPRLWAAKVKSGASEGTRPPKCPPDGEATQLSLDFLNFFSVARHCIVTRNAGARITYLVQYLVNQSREPGLERIRTLTLPLGQDHPYEVIDVRYW